MFKNHITIAWRNLLKKKIYSFGIRKVLGAEVSSIVTLLSMDFIKLVLAAILIATPVTWYVMNRWLEDFAYKTDIS